MKICKAAWLQCSDKAVFSMLLTHKISKYKHCNKEIFASLFNDDYLWKQILSFKSSTKGEKRYHIRPNYCTYPYSKQHKNIASFDKVNELRNWYKQIHIKPSTPKEKTDNYN